MRSNLETISILLILLGGAMLFTVLEWKTIQRELEIHNTVSVPAAPPVGAP